MRPPEIKRAIGAALAICGAYREHPNGAQECLRLDLAASNIAALFEMRDDSPPHIRCLLLDAAFQARAVAIRLRSASWQPDKAMSVSHAVVEWEAALLELQRELDSNARST